MLMKERTQFNENNSEKAAQLSKEDHLLSLLASF
jgi:hypothetical protein